MPADQVPARSFRERRQQLTSQPLLSRPALASNLRISCAACGTTGPGSSPSSARSMINNSRWRTHAGRPRARARAARRVTHGPNPSGRGGSRFHDQPLQRPECRCPAALTRSGAETTSCYPALHSGLRSGQRAHPTSSSVSLTSRCCSRRMREFCAAATAPPRSQAGARPNRHGLGPPIQTPPC